MNSEHYNFNRKMITSLKDVLGKVAVHETTSETNLRQFRERQERNRAEREARAEENRQKRAEAEEAKNTPEAVERRLAADRQRVETERNRNSANPRSEAESTLLNASLARLRKAGENPQMPRREPGVNAGKTRTDTPPDIGANGRPLSINRDGSFNIPQPTTQQNEPSVQRPTPQPGQVGGPGGYINPNSPEGRIFGQIKSGDLSPDVLDPTRPSQQRLIAATTNMPKPVAKPTPRPFTPPQRPTPLAPRPTPPSPIAPRPTPPTPLKPQAGEEDFSQLFGSRYRPTSGGPRYA